MSGSGLPGSDAAAPRIPDSELWRKVTETVTPLKGRASEPAAPEPAKPAVSHPVKKTKLLQSTAQPKTKQAPTPKIPPLASLDRKLTRRVGRGSRDVDAVIDLHGLTQREAHHRLLSFLQNARSRGHRLVLVVTGKGRADEAGDWWEEGRRGVLRRAVPEWLGTPPFRLLVVGYEQAHGHRGGEGAIYVQVRRKDRAERTR
jgi:DNA-nicking Smr family endonuclease